MLFEPRDASNSFANLTSATSATSIPSSLGETASGVATSVADTTQSTATSVWGWFQSLSFLKYIAIFLILAVLGLNVFTILGNTTDTITDTVGGPVRRLVAAFAWITGETAKQVVTTTADGLEKTVDVAEDVAVGGIDVVEKTLTGGGGGGVDSALKKLSDEIDSDVEADDDTGDTLKSGYCYIGADRGVRSCARVGEADKCMSGDIFPTKATCVNPKLRA